MVGFVGFFFFFFFTDLRKRSNNNGGGLGFMISPRISILRKFNFILISTIANL